MIIYTEEQFKAYLKKNDINYKKFDDKGKDNDKDSYAMANRRYYENPLLWKIIFEDKKYEDGKEFLLKNYFDKIDFPIVSNLISIINEDNEEVIYNKIIPYQLNKSTDSSYDMDNYLLESITEHTDNINIYFKIYDIALKYKIDPKYGTYGNIGHGQGLLEAVKTGSKKLIEHFISNKIDFNENESLAIPLALKYGFYTIGLMLKDAGGDLYTRNNLGLKMIERNDKNKELKLSDENESARKILLELYKNHNKSK